MSFFRSSEQLYTILEEIFSKFNDSNSASVETFKNTKLLIRIQLTQPEAILYINGRKTPVSITYGNNRLFPDIDIRMPADVFHLILSNQLSIKSAFLDKKLVVKGAFWKTSSLNALFDESRIFYSDVLSEHGLEMD